MSEPFLFVSHVREDRAAAMEIVDELERRGLRCWIAPRDIRPGMPYDDAIADAIDASLALLLIFSEHCNRSEYIRREVTVAGESRKVIIPFRIENVEPKHGLRVRLSDLHWLDGFASKKDAINELIRTFAEAKKAGSSLPAAGQALRARAPKPRETSEPRAGTQAATRRGGDRDEAGPRRGSPARRPSRALGLALAAVACLILAAVGIWAYAPLSSYFQSKTEPQVAVQPAPMPAPAPPPTAAPPFSSVFYRRMPVADDPQADRE